MIKSISIHKDGRKGWIAYVVSELTNTQGNTLHVVKDFRRETLIALLLEVGSELNQSTRTNAK